MKVVIAGTRTIRDRKLVELVIRQSGIQHLIEEVVSGAAHGVDTLGEEWARSNGIQLKRFPVTTEMWDAFGKGAAIIRNRQMAEYADAAIVIWDGASRGTMNMIDQMYRLRKPAYIWIKDKGFGNWNEWSYKIEGAEWSWHETDRS